MGTAGMAEDKKNARRWRACLIFVDESGFCLIPPTRRTWSRRGQTPIVRHQFSWPKLSAISGITRGGRLYLHLVRGTIKSERVIRFLSSLLYQIHRKIIVIWDNGPIHRSGVVRDWVRQHPRLLVEPLPGYAYELNADEGVWEHLKGAPLGNFCAANAGELEAQIRLQVHRLRRRKRILRSFFKRTPLARV